jgi:hypothetical protein
LVAGLATRLLVVARYTLYRNLPYGNVPLPMVLLLAAMPSILPSDPPWPPDCVKRPKEYGKIAVEASPLSMIGWALFSKMTWSSAPPSLNCEGMQASDEPPRKPSNVERVPEPSCAV